MLLTRQESSGFSLWSHLFILSDFSVLMYLLPGECWSLAWILWRDFPWRWTRHPLLSFVKVQVLMLVNLPVCCFVSEWTHLWFMLAQYSHCFLWWIYFVWNLRTYCFAAQIQLPNSSLGTSSTSSTCLNEEEVILFNFSSFLLFCSTAFECLKTVDYVYKFI